MKSSFALSSVRTRLTLWNAAVVTLILLVGGLALHCAMRAVLSDSLDRALELRAGPFLTKRARPPFRPGPVPPPPPRHGLNLQVLDRQGHQRFSRRGPFAPAAFPRSLLGETLLLTVRRGDDEWRVYSAPNRDRNREIVGVVQVQQPLATVDDAMASLDRVLLMLLPVGLLAAGAGGALLTAQSLRPVQRITAAAERIQAENLSERLPVLGRDEYADLSVTLNAMLGRLQSAFEEQRRFTSDASHELKTPLTAIKAKTSVALTRPRSAEAYRETVSAVDSMADQMTALVQSLLQLAQADAGRVGRDRCRVTVRDIIEMGMDLTPPRDGPAILVDIPEPSPAVCGSPSELARVISNLAENARRHTPPAGRVLISASERPGQVEIVVSDTGEGIAPEHLPHLGERFYRVDTVRGRADGGTGLGLAICKSIVDAHGGQMWVESRVGSGTAVHVQLPA